MSGEDGGRSSNRPAPSLQRRSDCRVALEPGSHAIGAIGDHRCANLDQQFRSRSAAGAVLGEPCIARGCFEGCHRLSGSRNFGETRGGIDDNDWQSGPRDQCVVELQIASQSIRPFRGSAAQMNCIASSSGSRPSVPNAVARSGLDSDSPTPALSERSTNCANNGTAT